MSNEAHIDELDDEIARLRAAVTSIISTLTLGALEGPVYCDRPECMIAAALDLARRALGEEP